MFWREFCIFVLFLFKTRLKHYLLASINDENLGTKLNKILAPFGSRTGKIEDKIMKSSHHLSVEDSGGLAQNLSPAMVDSRGP